MILYTKILNDLKALGADRMRLGTDRIEAVLKTFGDPQNEFKSIHVVGTNGKGSTSKLLASIYQAAGYRVGLFTSPDLTDVRERIQLNNALIPEQIFAELGKTVLDKSQELNLSLSYFECLTVIGFLYFQQEQVDIALIEAGLGGRLDSTNVLSKPLAIVITPISEDHQDLLGETLTAIAQEKVAVLKAHCPVISAEQTNEAKAVIDKQAELRNAPLSYASSNNWQIGELNRHAGRREIRDAEENYYHIQLLGRYQAQNIAVATQTIESLSKTLPVDEKALKTGIESAIWPGRYQLFPHKNLIIDGSHNSQGINTLIESLKEDFKDVPIRLGLSLLQSKPIEALFPLLHALPIEHVSCIISPQVVGMKAYITAESLKTQFQEENLNLKIETQSLDEFLANSSNTSLSVLTGSLYTAGSALTLLRSTHA